MAKATILIVDKEKILIDLLVRTLSTSDVSVLGATSADEAARLVDKQRPDLLVIDPSVENAGLLITSVSSGAFETKVVHIDRNAGLDALVTTVRAALPGDLQIVGHPGRAKILICDDEPELRTVLLDFLKSRGYSVTTASNGEEALEMLKADDSIQIVLLDVSMPRIGGMEVLKHIMKSNPHPDVIMLSGVADREIARQAIKVGAFDYMLKPFDFPAIEGSVEACLSYSEYQKQPWWKRLTRK
jgi:DNA-binding NtrC family response regulator